MKSVEEFLDAYRNGERYFHDLEFDHEESFKAQDLRGSTFKNCWFSADFTYTNLKGCKFFNCNLKTSDFSNANLSRASMKDCTVESTSYIGATVDGFVFEGNFHYGAIVGQNDFIKYFQFD